MINSNCESQKKTGEICDEPPFNHDDEINLVDYFLVLWKRKTFILLGTVLPAVCVAAGLLLLPRDYTTTYSYYADNLHLNQKNYEVMLDRFYGEENLAKLVERLKKDGLGDYAQKLGNSIQPQEYVKLEAIPAFLDISKLNTATADAENLAKILEMNASLLNVSITDKHANDLYQIASVVRQNIEKVMPLYVIQKSLSDTIRNDNQQIANIESNRFSLELSMKNNNDVLAGLKRISVEGDVNKQGEVTLQFDIGGQNQYLPLGYQIQAAESKRIELEETIKANEEKYKYYTDLVDMNNTVLAELDAKLSGDYTIDQFKAFLITLLAGSEKPQVKDYLSSYIRNIENVISANRPATEKPKIVAAEKGTAKKTAVVFSACLMLSALAAFLVEAFEQNKARTS